VITPGALVCIFQNLLSAQEASSQHKAQPLFPHRETRELVVSILDLYIPVAQSLSIELLLCSNAKYSTRT